MTLISIITVLKILAFSSCPYRIVYICQIMNIQVKRVPIKPPPRQNTKPPKSICKPHFRNKELCKKCEACKLNSYNFNKGQQFDI